LNEQQLREKLGIAAESILATGLNQHYTAAALEIYVDDEAAYSGNFGTIAPGQPTIAQTLFDLGEVTELFTKTLFLQYVSIGRIWLDTPVNVLLEEADEALNFYHLLTHTSGLRSTIDLCSLEDYDARLAAIEKAKPVQPGAKVNYSPLAFMQMGLALENLHGLPFDQALSEMLLQPLGMSAQYAPLSRLLNVAPNVSNFQREPYDENTRCLEGVSGHSGLFATAANVVKLAQIYLSNGDYQGDQIISEALTAEALREHQPGQRFAWKASGDYSFVEGETGTLVWINPAQKLACALLTNASYYGSSRETLENLKAALVPAIQTIIEEA
jgi:CubicO group peptidase (beta-lactamase class C family)